MFTEPVISISPIILVFGHSIFIFLAIISIWFLQFIYNLDFFSSYEIVVPSLKTVISIPSPAPTGIGVASSYPEPK